MFKKKILKHANSKQMKINFAKLLVFVIEKTIGMDFFISHAAYNKLIETGMLKPTFCGTTGHYDVVTKNKQLEEAAAYWHRRWQDLHQY